MASCLLLIYHTLFQVLVLCNSKNVTLSLAPSPCTTDDSTPRSLSNITLPSNNALPRNILSNATYCKDRQLLATISSPDNTTTVKGVCASAHFTNSTAERVCGDVLGYHGGGYMRTDTNPLTAGILWNVTCLGGKVCHYEVGLGSGEVCGKGDQVVFLVCRHYLGPHNDRDVRPYATILNSQHNTNNSKDIERQELQKKQPSNTKQSADSHQPCDSGHHWSKHASKCVKCRKNTYSNNNTQPKCQGCPLGHFSEPGSAFCTSCLDGTFYANGTCFPCPSGHFSDGGVACVPCTKGEVVGDDGLCERVLPTRNQWYAVIGAFCGVILLVAGVWVYVTRKGRDCCSAVVDRMQYGDLIEDDMEVVAVECEELGEDDDEVFDGEKPTSSTYVFDTDDIELKTVVPNASNTHDF